MAAGMPVYNSTKVITHLAMAVVYVHMRRTGMQGQYSDQVLRNI